MLNRIKPCLENLTICIMFLPKSIKNPTQVSLGSSDRGFVEYFSIGG